jgi:hypothetical protein
MPTWIFTLTRFLNLALVDIEVVKAAKFKVVVDG